MSPGIKGSPLHRSIAKLNKIKKGHRIIGTPDYIAPEII